MDKQPAPVIPTRRDIRFLRKSQRQRFFFCLKFLSVLPPQEQGNFRKFNVAWKVQNGQRYYKNVNPRNIHDQFISSHQTCCQHGTLYFLYYHRHLMTCFEISLNFAEEVLLGGKQRVPATLYNSNAKYFDAVFNRYGMIIASLRNELGLAATADLPQVSAHYWNPVDYTTNISIPQELRERTPDVMDQLYFAVNAHYAWTFNFATRWFGNNSAQPKLPLGFQTMGFFSSTEVNYSAEENKIIYGTLNPRSTVQEEFFGIDFIDQYGIPYIANTASEINYYKNYKKLKETGTSINVCTLDQDEINTLFGSKVKNLHWISSKQRALISVNNSIKASSYNKSLPHFQFAYSLYKKSNIFLKDYVTTQSINPENSMQRSHNTMHNLLQLFMSDSQISITNPLFFLYHSWIDYQLQVKIRMIRTDPIATKSEYAYSKTYLDTRIKPFSVLDQVSGPGQLKYGDYYIFEWANPATKFPPFNQPLTKQDSQVAFKARNFIINDDKQGIRRSDELSAFYKKDYLPNNTQRYSYFKNLNKFIFDYNYQIHDYDKDGNRVALQMKNNTVVIPSYIKDIFSDYDSQWNRNKTSTIMPPKLNSFEEEDKKQAAVRKSLMREIRMNLGGYATYSSSIRSTVIPIQLKLTQKGQSYFKMTKQYEEVLKKGLVIAVASLFSRGVGSSICPNCKDEKEYYIFGSQKLAELNEDLFCEVSKGLTQKTFFKMKNKQVEPIQAIRLNEMFTLSTPRPVFNRLQLLQGALQVDFFVEFKGKEDYEHCKVAISLYSYSIQTNKLENIVIRKKQTLNGAQFQFPRVFGVREGQQHSQYVYRKVEGCIINGDERCNFQFDITARYRLITLLIIAEEKFDSNNQGYLDVQVVDKHYDFKMKHYNPDEVQIE